MSQVLINRRTGRPVTVSDKLARALARDGRYLRRDMQAAAPMVPVAQLPSEDRVERVPQTTEQSAPPDTGVQAEQAEQAAEAPPAGEAPAQETEAAASQPAAAQPDNAKRTRRNQRAG